MRQHGVPNVTDGNDLRRLRAICNDAKPSI
jgi:hypothetical protein